MVCVSNRKPVCDTMKRPSLQARRPGGAGPVRASLGGKNLTGLPDCFRGLHGVAPADSAGCVRSRSVGEQHLLLVLDLEGSQGDEISRDVEGIPAISAIDVSHEHTVIAVNVERLIVVTP